MKPRRKPDQTCPLCGLTWPGEEFSTCCPGACHACCVHPLPPADMPDWTPEGQANYYLRTSWGNYSGNTHADRQAARSNAGRRKGA